MKYLKSEVTTTILIMVIIVFCQNVFVYSAAAPIVNTEAIGFILKDLQGNDFDFNEFKGKTILFFWATWCPHCRAKIPKLNQEYPEMKKQGIEVLAIDIGESKERVEKFIEKNSVTFPVLFDYDSRVSKEYDILGVPTFILIGEDKVIISRDYDLPDNYLELFLQKKQ